MFMGGGERDIRPQFGSRFVFLLLSHNSVTSEHRHITHIFFFFKFSEDVIISTIVNK